MLHKFQMDYLVAIDAGNVVLVASIAILALKCTAITYKVIAHKHIDNITKSKHPVTKRYREEHEDAIFGCSPY